MSTTSLVFERLGEREKFNGRNVSDFDDHDPLRGTPDDEREAFLASAASRQIIGMDKKLKRIILILVGLIVASWGAGLVVYLTSRSYQHSSEIEHDPEATATRGHGKRITLDQIHNGYWYPNSHEISWIEGGNGEDGLVLEKVVAGKGYLI